MLVARGSVAKHMGQAVAVVVADTTRHAEAAAALVKVCSCVCVEGLRSANTDTRLQMTFEDVQKPVLTIEEVPLTLSLWPLLSVS